MIIDIATKKLLIVAPTPAWEIYDEAKEAKTRLTKQLRESIKRDKEDNE